MITEEYKKFLPQLAGIAGLVEAPYAMVGGYGYTFYCPKEKLHISTAAQFDPLHDGDDAFKLLCGLRGEASERNLNISIFGTDRYVIYTFTNLRENYFIGQGDNDAEAIIALGIAYIKSQEVTL
jgi:hypothetical protein